MENKNEGNLSASNGGGCVSGMMSNGPVMNEEKISNLEQLKRHEIHIIFLDRGCIVRVGCKSIPFENIGMALSAIRAYTENPAQQTELWQKEFNSINK